MVKEKLQPTGPSEIFTNVSIYKHNNKYVRVLPFVKNLFRECMARNAGTMAQLGYTGWSICIRIWDVSSRAFFFSGFLGANDWTGRDILTFAQSTIGLVIIKQNVILNQGALFEHIRNYV